MLHPSTKKLIDKLYEMTRKQRVAWIEGENGTLVHDTEGYRVVVTPEPHAVLLTDALGREIETCHPEEFSDEQDAQGRPYAKFVGELYREAHRHARGTEKAIRTLLAGLDAAEAEPEPGEQAEAEASRDMTTDETAQIDGESAITEAVASLANQINQTSQPRQAQPADEAETRAPPGPSIEAETSSAPPGDAAPDETSQTDTAQSQRLTDPDREPEGSAAPTDRQEAAQTDGAEAGPVPVLPANPMQQRFSLSGIPYGMGVAGTPAAPAPAPSEARPVAPRTLVIDGTEDLPDIIPGIPDAPRVAGGYDELPEPPASNDKSGPPGNSLTPPRRFNPWN